jgi:ribosomal protein S18 acetylase RimI-like enzyme
MNGTGEAELLARVEEAGINASAPREQLWIDGWLVRFSPGKAKRARCIQAVANGRLPIETRLNRCLHVYTEAGLRPYFRITPFSQPPELDRHLAEMGMERIDDTRVMIAPLPLTGPDVATSGEASGVVRFATSDADAFARWIGSERGSTEAEIAAHTTRLRNAPVLHHAVLVIDVDGTAIAGGQVVQEDGLAGLYDVHTVATARRRGIAEALCRHLLAHASARSANLAYLQVDAANDAARRVYRRLGFEDAYSYHYRSPPAR